MSYKLATEKKDGYLLAIASGLRSFETVLSLTKDVLSVCTKEKTNRVLMDLRALKGHLETLEAFKIPDHYFPKLRYQDVLTRCAVIDLKEYEERGRFFEDVAVNRGFFIRFFCDPGEAVEWLNR